MTKLLLLDTGTILTHVCVYSGACKRFIPYLIVQNVNLSTYRDHVVAIGRSFTIPSDEVINVKINREFKPYRTPETLIYCTVPNDIVIESPIGKVVIKKLEIPDIVTSKCTLCIPLPFGEIVYRKPKLYVDYALKREVQTDIENYVEYFMGKFDVKHLIIRSTIETMYHHPETYRRIDRIVRALIDKNINGIIFFNEKLHVRLLIDRYDEYVIDKFMDTFDIFMPRVAIISTEIIKNIFEKITKVRMW